MQILLHIGTDKTGSTSIQNTLFLNRDWLAARSIYVPTTGLGRGNGHARLLRSLDTEQLDSLADELRVASENGFQRALLSGEGMGSFRFGSAKIRRLSTALRGFPVRILVYLREQAEIIQSGHLQQVKRNRNVIDIRALEKPRNPVEGIRAFITLRNPNRNYYRLLRRWQRCIPGATFSVRIYDRPQLHGGDVVTDFLAQLNVCKGGKFISARENYNDSLTVEAALMLESLQKLPSYAEQMVTLVDVTQSVISLEEQSTRYFLTEAAVQSVRKHFRRSNLKLARRFMGRDTCPFPASGACWRTGSLAEIEARAAQLAGKVAKVREIPTLMGEATGEEIASMIELSSGWSTPRAWGAWSTGKESRIRFRLFRHALLQEVSSVRLFIEGRYYGNNRTTIVQVNGIGFGEQSLVAGTSGFALPLEALRTHEVVEIVLGHTLPVSPAVFEKSSDGRELAFGLERVRYALIGTHD